MRILLPILLLAACVDVADDELATDESDLDIESVPITAVWFYFSQANGLTTNEQLANVQAGTSVRIGTCDMSDASYQGPNQLRLWNLTTNTEITDVIRTKCGNFDRDSFGIQLNYTVPYDMSIEVRAGCAGMWSCSGAVVLYTYLDATPRLANVKQAFTRIRSGSPTLSESFDADERVQGLYFSGGPAGGKYHIQGIARSYNRRYHDIVWSTSIKKEETPVFETVFFTKLATKVAIGRSQRFGSNLPLTIWDRIEYGSHAGVYDGSDDVPDDRHLDHSGGMQSIGNYVFMPSEFVSLPCTKSAWDPSCPDWGDHNIPSTGQTSQVVGYDLSQAQPQPRLLIERAQMGSGWVAVGKLPRTTNVPPMLGGGYLIAVPEQNRISLYAIAADGCSGFASLANVIPYRGGGVVVPDRTCLLGGGHSPDTIGDARPVELVGCVKRGDADPDCPELVTMWADGSRWQSFPPALFQFPDQEDVQSANFVTQTDGTLYLLAFVGYATGHIGANSHVQLWRVVFGTPSGIAAARSALPDGTTCSQFVCLVREGTEAAEDSDKGMAPTDINGNMFRYGGSGYIVGNPLLANESIYVYGSDHYIHESPRALWWNEF